MIQKLEPRALFSSSFSGGTLTVTGRSVADVISLAISNGKVTVTDNGVKSAAYAAVRRIVVNSLAGTDRVSVSPAITVPATLNGGSGNDTLSAGNGPTALFGDAGTDRAKRDDAEGILDSVESRFI